MAATGDGLGIVIPEKQKMSSDDEKLAEQLKALNSPSYATSKAGNIPFEIPFQYDMGGRKTKPDDFGSNLMNAMPVVSLDWPAILEASFHGDMDKVKQLLTQEETDINATAEDGMSALTVSSFKGHARIVKLLLAYGAKIELRNKSGSSALMLASYTGHYSIVKLLLEHGAKPNEQNSRGITALMMAIISVRRHQYRIAKLLLDHGAQPNIQADSSGGSALLLAISMHQYSVVKLLLKYNADVNLHDAEGTSGLVVACELGLFEMAKLLLANGAHLDGDAGILALQLASFHGHCEVARLLLDRGVLVNEKDHAGQTPLIGACCRGHYELVELLLNSGALPNSTRFDGCSALFVAVTIGHHRIARLLLQRGALPNLQNRDGYSALHIASSIGKYKVAEALIKAGANVNLQNQFLVTPLMLASASGHLDLAELLIENGADVDTQNYSGDSALIAALNDFRYEVAKLLLDNGARANLQGAEGRCALFTSSFDGQYDMTKLLINRGVNVDCKTTSEATPLMGTSFGGHYEVAELLLESGAKVNLQDQSGRFALFLACYIGNYEVAKLLLDHGAMVNLQDLSGRSSLHVSTRRGNSELTALLLARGAQPDLRNQNGHSALMIAVLTRSYEITALLLDAQVSAANLLRALQLAVNKTEDSSITELLFGRCVEVIKRNGVLHTDSGFPGVVFWDAPIHHCITSQGATIQSPHTGISLSIPEQALSSTEKDVDLLIHPCFSGPFELPAGYESTSPAYLIQPSRSVKIERDVTLQIHHYASLQSEEDCAEMTFLSGSPTPRYRDSKPVYVFKEIKLCKGIFKPNSQIGEIALRHFCFMTIARKQRASDVSFGQGDAGTYYSARLYRCNTDLSGVAAVFCMCLYHPLCIECSDRRITKEFEALSTPCNHDLVQMKADEITLSVQHSKGWIVTFDRNPTKIRKKEVDVPKVLDFDLNMLTGYPPKFTIYMHPAGLDDDCSDSPQLVVQGLDVEDCSFKIVTPGSRKSASLPSTPSRSKSTPPVTPAGQNASSDSSLNLRCILTELVTVNKKWFNLGIELEIKYHELEQMKIYHHNDIEQCMAGMINKWLKTNTDQVSWGTLCAALRSELVGEPVLATEIEKKYCAVEHSAC